MTTRRVSLVAVALAAVLSIVGLAAPPTGAATTLTPSLTTSASATTWSEYITLTAMFTPPKGQPKPTGTVTFTDGEDTTVGSIALANGVARLRTRDLPAGTHTITATHQGDGTYPAGTTTGPVTVTVAQAHTTTTLVSKKTEVLSGTAWFQATVAPVAPAGGTPTGSVAFTAYGDDGSTSATAPLSGGIATWRPRLPDGLHTVTAAFVGSPGQQPSASASVRQRIGPVPTAGPVDQDTTAAEPIGSIQLNADGLSGQVVTAGRDGWLDQIDLLVLSAETTSDLTVRIHPVGSDGRPTDDVLGSGHITVPTSTDRPVSVPLDVPIPMSAGDVFALSLDAPNLHLHLWHQDDTYPGGTLLVRPEGESWQSIPVDLWFRTRVTPFTTSELTVSTATAVASQQVDLTARWTTNRSAAAPTGTVRFLADGEEVGTAPILGGVARLRTRDLPVGSAAVTATYDGDDTYEAGPIAGSPTVTVAPLATTTTLVSRKNPVTSGTAWFQATVATVAPATAAPDGEVAFFLDGAASPAATVPVGVGVASWRPRLADGVHTVTTRFVPRTGTQQQSASDPVSQRIGMAPAPASSVDQSNPGPATHVLGGDNLGQTFVAGATGLLHKVAFVVDGTSNVRATIYAVDQDGLPTGDPLGSSAVASATGYTERTLATPASVQSGQQYALVLNGPSAVQLGGTSGRYAQGGAITRPSWSSTFMFFGSVDLVFTTWVRPIPATEATFTATDTQLVQSQYVTLTARWTSPDGGILPTGTVRFLDGGVEVGTATISGGVATLRTKALPLGTRTITAVYGGDTYFPQGAVGAPIVVQVGSAETTTTLVSKKLEVLSGTAWFQATVAPVAPATATPTDGSVAFHLEGLEGPAAIVPVVGGVATWRPRLDDGSYTVTAVYLGGGSHDSSESTPIVQLIGPPPPATVD